ncbi:MAG: dihydroneopterin aldolase [Planctomycetota bacterium]
MADAPATSAARSEARWPAAGGPPAGGALDVVSIRNLRAWTLIGVHPHEREMRQEVRIDAWLGTDVTDAARDDDLDASIDYAAVSRAFREHAGGASHQLVETLAEELAAIALERFGALAVRISVEKPGAVPGADAVGVTIERPREGRGGAPA